MFIQITFSPTGGTKKAADLLSTAWTEKTEIDLCQREMDFSQYSFEKTDVCLVAVPSFGGRVPQTATERLKQMQGNGAKAILVAVYGNRAYEDTLLELADTLTAQGFQPIGGAAVVAEHSILREFAAGRPDAADAAQLKAWSVQLKEKALQDGSVSLPGNRPYQKYATLPITPKAGAECNGCGACAAKCPVGAISPEYPKQVDEARCISCMACVAACPQQARKVNPLLLAGAKLKLKKALEGRKENELFL